MRFQQEESLRSWEDSLLLIAVKWVCSQNRRYYFAFYTGVPETIGANNYRNLAAIAYQVLILPSMRAYGGTLKYVKFPDNVQELISELTVSASAVTIPQTDEGWMTLKLAATKIRTTLLAHTFDPTVTHYDEPDDDL